MKCGRGDNVGFKASAKSVSRNSRAMNAVGDYFSSNSCISAEKAVILRRSQLLLLREVHHQRKIAFTSSELQVCEGIALTAVQFPHGLDAVAVK